jgi:hypothetical protein
LLPIRSSGHTRLQPAATLWGETAGESRPQAPQPCNLWLWGVLLRILPIPPDSPDSPDSLIHPLVSPLCLPTGTKGTKVNQGIGRIRGESEGSEENLPLSNYVFGGLRLSPPGQITFLGASRWSNYVLLGPPWSNYVFLAPLAKLRFCGASPLPSYGFGGLPLPSYDFRASDAEVVHGLREHVAVGSFANAEFLGSNRTSDETARGPLTILTMLSMVSRGRVWYGKLFSRPGPPYHTYHAFHGIPGKGLVW